MKFNRLLAISLSFVVVSSCSKPTISETAVCTAPVYPQYNKGVAFQQIIDKYTQEGLPGISLLVQDSNGIWAGASGYADIAQQIPMQSCHVGKVASLTKIFMGALTFKLVEEGVLDINKLVSDYLSSQQLKYIANADVITVKQLMNHTTGIFDVITDNAFYLDVLNNPPKHRNQEDILKFVRGKEALFAPGTNVAYSNTNTLLLSMVIDKVAGKSHAALLREKIIDPLGLVNSFYYYHDALPAGKVTQGYYDLYNNGRLENLSSYNTGSGNGYTGLYSNVHDLYTFIDALFIKKTLLNASSLDQMLDFNPLEEPNSDRLLGPGSVKDFIHRPVGQYAWGHRGRDLAYSADMFYFPEKNQVLVLMVNYGTDGDSKLRPNFYNLRKEIVDKMME